MGYNDFKNKVCNSFNKEKYAAKKMEKLKAALDRAVLEELPQRDKSDIWQFRDFRYYDGRELNVKNSHLMCKWLKKEKQLMVAVKAPDWRNGWKNISKDDFVSDSIEGIFFFIGQYVIRSSQINLICAIALTTGQSCDFRGNTIREFNSLYNKNEIYNFENSIQINSKFDKEVAAYMSMINSLDPYVNRAVFYYVKALRLIKDEYEEEALTSADNMVDVIFQAIWFRSQQPSKSREDEKAWVYRQLLLGDSDDIANLDFLYKLRCEFTAHPARAKWWDFAEIYDNNIEQIIFSVKKLLIKFFKYEKCNRLVEPNPKKWSVWFCDNAEIIYDVIWFDNLP